MSLPKRIWDKIDKGGIGTGCWLWTGARKGDRHRPRCGYGAVRIDGQTRPVHRMVWEELRGPIPKGLVIDHLCRVTHCCNPDHLEPVTNEENIRRGYRWLSKRKCCKWGHEFTEESTCTRMGWRTCRTCARLRSAAFRERAKALT